MKRNDKYRRWMYSRQWWLLTTLLLILVGCATGPKPGWQDPKYANPSVKHVKELPENQAAAADLKGASQGDAAFTPEEHEKAGDAMLLKGELAMAYYHYEKARESRPGDLNLTCKMGLALVKVGKNDAAIGLFRTVLSADPDHAAAHGGIGRALVQKREFDEAEPHLRKAVALSGALWREYLYLGLIYDHRKSWDQAAAAYRTALQKRPEEAVIHHNYGVSRYMAGDYPAAAAAFRKAIDLSFDPEIAYNNLGLALAGMGRYTQALEAFRKGVGEARAHNNMGWVYLNNGMLAEAAASFEKAMAASPVYYPTAASNLQIAQNRLNARMHGISQRNP